MKALANASSTHLTPSPFLDFGPETLTCPATRELAARMFIIAAELGEGKARQAVRERDAHVGYFHQIDLAEERKFILPIASEMRR